MTPETGGTLRPRRLRLLVAAAAVAVFAMAYGPAVASATPQGFIFVASHGGTAGLWRGSLTDSGGNGFFTFGDHLSATGEDAAGGKLYWGDDSSSQINVADLGNIGGTAASLGTTGATKSGIRG